MSFISTGWKDTIAKDGATTTLIITRNGPDSWSEFRFLLSKIEAVCKAEEVTNLLKLTISPQEIIVSFHLFDEKVIPKDIRKACDIISKVDGLRVG